MNIQKSALRATSFLTVASAVLWLGSAAAAPLPTTYPTNSAALFASLMQDPADDTGGSPRLSADLQRQVAPYATAVAAGTIIIDTSETYLYYVLGNGQAIRYGIGVGRDGFTWSGSQAVTRMAEWPDWTPPQEMIARQPYLPRWCRGCGKPCCRDRWRGHRAGCLGRRPSSAASKAGVRSFPAAASSPAIRPCASPTANRTR